MPSRTPAKRAPRRRKVEETAEQVLRDRIVEFRRVPSSELLDNEKNWRTHPYAQRAAIAELLDRVGIAGALTAYHSKRNGGKLTLIDGHARKADHDAEWPTLILDVTDEEADLLLLTLDPITAAAGADASALESLIAEARAGTPALEDLVRDLREQAHAVQIEAPVDEGGPAEMELQPFEHYDYIVLLFRDQMDWLAAKELFGLKNEAFTLRDGERKKVGLGRVVDGRRVLDMLFPEVGEVDQPKESPRPRRKKRS